MAVPKRKRTDDSGNIIREVYVNSEWKKDSRSSSINEWIKLIIIVFTSFGFFKGGEITFDKITAQEKHDYNIKIKKAVDWAAKADETLSKKSLTMRDVVRHIDPNSKLYSEIHITPYNANTRFVTRKDFEKVIKNQEEVSKKLTKLEASSGIVATLISRLDKKLDRLDSRK